MDDTFLIIQWFNCKVDQRSLESIHWIPLNLKLISSPTMFGIDRSLWTIEEEKIKQKSDDCCTNKTSTILSQPLFSEFCYFHTSTPFVRPEDIQCSVNEKKPDLWTRKIRTKLISSSCRYKPIFFAWLGILKTYTEYLLNKVRYYMSGKWNENSNFKKRFLFVKKRKFNLA